MKTIEATVEVSSKGIILLQLPPDISPGKHRIVLVVDERIESTTRSGIDAALSHMASDLEYQAEAKQIEAEFSIAQWESLQQLEAKQ